MQTEETNNTLQELEELRSQYNELKKEVDKQQIINDRILRNSMKNAMVSVSHHKWIALAAGISSLPLLWFVCRDLGMRPYFYIVSAVFMIVMVISAFLTHRTPDAGNLSGQNTLYFIKSLKKIKEIHFRHFRIFYPAFIIWIGVFIGEVLHSSPADGSVIGIILGIAAGAIIGSIIGFIIHNRIIGIYEGLILQMENKDLYVETLK